MEIAEKGIEADADVTAALEWFASVTSDPDAFWQRLARAQAAYRDASSLPANRGRDLELDALGRDIVGGFLAQPKSLLDDRRSFDLVLGAQTVPWLKQIGRNVALLDDVPGARERADRMLKADTVHPGSAMFELAMASNYASDGFDVGFVEEARGSARTPDLRLSLPGLPPVHVECKRLYQGKYETNERKRHRELFRKAAALIDERGLSVHIDVTYTQELANVPEDYLAERLERAISTPIVTLDRYPWSDVYAYGVVRAGDLAAVKRDTSDSSLYFGPKLARLLSGRPVTGTTYCLAAGADPDRRDPRFIEEIHYGSVVTWQCIAPESMDQKARFVKSKLREVDDQLVKFGPGIAHLAMDADLQSQASDLRRSRNTDAITGFQPRANLVAIYLHYLIPRVSELAAWMIDETVDRFGLGSDPLPTFRIFPQSVPVDNELRRGSRLCPFRARHARCRV